MPRAAIALLVALMAVALGAVAVGAGAAAGPAPPCNGRQLRGSFTEIRGSAGAGHVSYRLTLRNHSRQSCFVSGIPSLVLRGRRGHRLPTHVSPAAPGTQLAIRVVLGPRARAHADARFSPTVPTGGEPMRRGLCEPSAYSARVTPPPGRGSLVVKLRPPTPVCGRGTLRFSNFTG